jgi:hypothetical protein
MQKMGILLNRLAASIQNQLWILDPASLRKKAGTTSPAGRGALFCLVFDNSQIQDENVSPGPPIVPVTEGRWVLRNY